MQGLSRSDWALMLLAEAERPLLPVHVQKVLFLMCSSGLPGTPSYQFLKWDYGPFSPQIYSDLENLAHQGLVEINAEARVRTYALTERGRSKAADSAVLVEPTTLAHLKQLVRWAQNLTFTQLVRAIYDRYPEYRERSVFSG